MAVSPSATDLEIRNAGPQEAEGLARVLTALRDAGLRRKPGDARFALAHYIAHPDRLACIVARDSDGRTLGFQSLKHARAGNPYGTPVGWAIIGTHVHPDAMGHGIGRLLFAATSGAARDAGVATIDAPIGSANAAGLGFYDALGFVTWRESPSGISKRYDP